MTDSFAVHLGGGTYLDASGNVTFGPPTDAQIYTPPAGFRVDLKSAQEAFKGLAELLPANDEALEKWNSWGVPEGMVSFLGNLAGVAGVAATVAGIYAWAIGLALKIVGAMGEQGMSPELGKTLNSIKNQMKGFEQVELAAKMIAMRSEFDGRIDRMRGLLMRILTEKPGEPARAQIFAEMRNVVDELTVPLSNVRDQEWTTTVDSDDYAARAFASPLLVFEHADGTLAPVPLQAPGLTHFDYRLGVPMMLYAAGTFVGLAQVAMPWLRSSGTYAGALRKTADAIDRFVMRMQDECLARTEYTARTVLQQKTWPIFAIPGSGPRPSLDATYAVGAFDLVRYDDAFFGQRLSAQMLTGDNPGRRGLFNYYWSTAWTSLFDVADAANVQARRDYAELQTATGMFRLITTASWLRFMSTPPETSETVRGAAADSRAFQSEEPTTATSPSIFPVGVISYPATRRRYSARSRVRFTTQEPGYAPAFHYKIVLRTLEQVFTNEAWDERPYVGDVWRTEYVPAEGDPRCQRLRTEFRESAVLSERVLYEGPSPADLVTRQGSATITATTFDWYVPHASAWGVLVEAGKDYVTSGAIASPAKKKMSSGGVSVHLLGDSPMVAPPMRLLDYSSPLIGGVVDEPVDFDVFAALDDVALDKAERRHVRVEDVTLDWHLAWERDKLQVRLSGNADNRPFQAWVVVEEIVYSGEEPTDDIGDVLSDEQLTERIHTPVAAEIVNQIVLVPEQFFTDERRAFERGEKMWRDFMDRFSEERPVGPGDPIESLHDDLRDMVTRSKSTATLARTLDLRVRFARTEAPELWGRIAPEP